MKKLVYEINLKENKSIKVFCSTQQQKIKLSNLLVKNSINVKDCKVIETGVNTIEQFETYLNNL